MADAPMGVALPPKSVPRDSAHDSTPKSIPLAAAIERITGIIVAAKGMLSTNALVSAETQRMITTMTAGFPPLTAVMNCAMMSSTPVSSSPDTDTNSPTKNSSVL